MTSSLRPLALLSLAVGVLSGPTDQVFARAACKDNLGRCFLPTGTKPTDIASRSAATAFCSSLLAVPVVTSTLSTTTPVTAITVTATVVASTEVQTSVTESDVQATASTQTTLTTYVSNAPQKRAVTAEALPKCATGGGYSPAQLTSACACVSVTPSTTYVTATAPVATNTATEISSVTTTTVTVETSTTTTGTTTIVATATATGLPCSRVASPYIVNGKSFSTVCNNYNSCSDYISTGTVVPGFNYCIDLCAATPGCVYAFWVHPGSRFTTEYANCDLCRDVHSKTNLPGSDCDSIFLDGA